VVATERVIPQQRIKPYWPLNPRRWHLSEVTVRRVVEQIARFQYPLARF